MNQKRKGLVHLYTGDGKGKTTAAMGLALRACGHNMRVVMVQFLKKSNRYGELVSVRWLKGLFEIIQTGKGCQREKTDPTFQGVCTGCMLCHVDPKNPKAEDREAAASGFQLARERLLSGHYHLVILDEIVTALSYTLLTKEEVLHLIKAKPDSVELVLTGRGAPEELMALADYVTEMRLIKHPFLKGIEAREGVEY